MSLVWPNGTTKEPARSDGYGPRRSIHTSAGWTRPFHAGTDHHSIGSLKAIGAGTVVQNSWISWAGWQIVIDLGVISGVRTWVRYCHLAAQSPVKVGQRVARGQTVGTEGATGQVVGRHLHWEIYRGRIDRGNWGDSGTTVDPRSFVSARLVKPTVQEEDTDMIFIRRNVQSKVYAWNPLTGKKRAIGTTEWNTIRRAYGAGKLAPPITNVSAAEAKHFGI